MIRPVTIVVALAVLAGALVVAGEKSQFAVRSAERAIYAQTCEHYRSRARTEPSRHTAAGDFVVFLASTCGAAEASLDTGTLKQRARSALLLSRIVLLRETIRRMNAERVVARLMIAFDAWLDSGVDFSLAFSR